MQRTSFLISVVGRGSENVGAEEVGLGKHKVKRRQQGRFNEQVLKTPSICFACVFSAHFTCAVCYNCTWFLDHLELVQLLPRTVHLHHIVITLQDHR